MKNILIALLMVFPASSFAGSKTYKIDATHSIVSFKIGHLIGKVRGSFSSFSGEVEHDEKNLKKFKAIGNIDVGSVDTNNQKRDDHLKSPDFFDIDNKEHPKYKTITYEAKNFNVTESSNGTHKGKLNGYITIHGKKQPITLDATINGNPVLDPFGNARISVSAEGSLNRQDFGLTWEHPAGELVVGDIVEIELEIQGARKVKAPKKKASK